MALAAEAASSYLAKHDALTALANRTQFEIWLANAIRSAKTGGLNHGLLFLDVACGECGILNRHQSDIRILSKERSALLDCDWMGVHFCKILNFLARKCHEVLFDPKVDFARNL